MITACYRKLGFYKYQLMRSYILIIYIKSNADIVTNIITLSDEGIFTIKIRYAWNEPGETSIDTKSFMCGSLVHDALYQLMRSEYLDYKTHRQYAYDLLESICLEDKTSTFRAWYVHQVIHIFGEEKASFGKIRR